MNRARLALRYAASLWYSLSCPCSTRNSRDSSHGSFKSNARTGRIACTRRPSTASRSAPDGPSPEGDTPLPPPHCRSGNPPPDPRRTSGAPGCPPGTRSLTSPPAACPPADADGGGTDGTPRSPLRPDPPTIPATAPRRPLRPRHRPPWGRRAPHPRPVPGRGTGPGRRPPREERPRGVPRRPLAVHPADPRAVRPEVAGRPFVEPLAEQPVLGRHRRLTLDLPDPRRPDVLVLGLGSVLGPLLPHHLIADVVGGSHEGLEAGDRPDARPRFRLPPPPPGRAGGAPGSVRLRLPHRHPLASAVPTRRGPSSSGDGGSIAARNAGA